MGDYYAHIAVAADTDDNRNTVFEIAVENQTKNEKIFSGSSSFGLSGKRRSQSKKTKMWKTQKMTMDTYGYLIQCL